jgi:hypothetical protein
MRWKSTTGITLASTRALMRPMSPAWMALSPLTASITSVESWRIIVSGARASACRVGSTAEAAAMVSTMAVRGNSGV